MCNYVEICSYYYLCNFHANIETIFLPAKHLRKNRTIIPFLPSTKYNSRTYTSTPEGLKTLPHCLLCRAKNRRRCYPQDKWHCSRPGQQVLVRNRGMIQ